ncbi:hypothetical protein PC123_g25589 [Phytophthora cactorum]|nr:hypothetical protein PC123_g25589 [Phytophthora cactorum]
MRTRSYKLSPWGTQAKQLSMMSSRPRNGSTVQLRAISVCSDELVADHRHVLALPIALRMQRVTTPLNIKFMAKSALKRSRRSVLGGFRAQGRTAAQARSIIEDALAVQKSALALVFHDLLGMLQHPHHAQFVPKFCKRYADVGEQIRVGLENYRDDVESGRFSSKAYSPYKMSKAEAQKLRAMVADKYSANYEEEDEDGAALSEVTKVY